MICRKCGHEWLVQRIPLPRDIDCPNCGAPIFKDHKYVEATSAEIARTQETRCRICGRTLTATLSVERGIGPVCWRRRKRGELKG